MGLLVRFALPLMLGNVFQQLYTVVDTAIVGQGVGLDALAALGTVDWLNWMLLGIAQGFTQGFAVRIAQKFGEGDGSGLRSYIGQSARLCLIIALISVLLSQAGLPVFLWMLRVPAELTEMATLYTRILMAGLPAVLFYNFCAAVLRAIGDSKTPLVAMAAAAMTNVVLDCVAVFVLGWGIAGAAAATVFSQCLSGVLCAWRIWKTPFLHFGKKELRHSGAFSADLMRIGTPVALKNVIIALGGMVVQAIVNGFGMSFIAGFTATNKLYGVLEIAALSYGYAVTTYVGQNYGAGKYGRIRSGMRSAIILSIATAVLIALVMVVFGRPITMLFISTETPEVAREAGIVAYQYLVTMAVFLPVLYLLYAHQAAIQGMGNTVVAMIYGMIEFVLRVGISLIVGITGYEMGIFWAEVGAWSGAAVYLIWRYRHCIRLLPTESDVGAG